MSYVLATALVQKYVSLSLAAAIHQITLHPQEVVVVVVYVVV